MADIKKIQLPSGDDYNIRDSRLPAVTTTDNNSILQVSSGSWSKASLPYFVSGSDTTFNGKITITTAPANDMDVVNKAYMINYINSLDGTEDEF
jgi:hypothetical protein